LQVHRSLAKAVTVDSEVVTNSRTMHTLTVVAYFKKTYLDELIADNLLMKINKQLKKDN
jgi:hypothetical protein